MSKNSFTFVFNKSENTAFDFTVVKRYNPNTPQKKYKEYEISGSDGKTYADLGIYEDIEISLDCNFIVNKKEFDWEDQLLNKLSVITLWLTDIEDNSLKFSDMFGYYYKVNTVKIINVERVMKQICRFTIVFNCKPFKYLESGQNFRTLAKI